jgi:NAD(P)-dependent dehydrogenase (short-subunit alcohol dehydrogenase family)
MALQIDFNGKVALITGVSSGIGKAIAETFAKAGAHVAGCATAESDADFSNLSKTYGIISLYISCDVTRHEDLKKVVDRTITHFGGLDILVSNAGRNVFKGAAGCTEEDWQYNHQLNLEAHWMLSKLCKPYLEKSGAGVIIIITSNHAFATISGCFPYNVTKTALTGLVRSLAIEWGPAIRTVGFAPGFIDTPGNQQWFDSFADAEAERQRTIGRHPVHRIGTPEEVGAWCVFLASSYAAFASGVTYLLDGGRSALMQDD